MQNRTTQPPPPDTSSTEQELARRGEAPAPEPARERPPRRFVTLEEFVSEVGEEQVAQPTRPRQATAVPSQTRRVEPILRPSDAHRAFLLMELLRPPVSLRPVEGEGWR
jgi:hypothetical protein